MANQRVNGVCPVHRIAKFRQYSSNDRLRRWPHSAVGIKGSGEGPVHFLEVNDGWQFVPVRARPPKESQADQILRAHSVRVAALWESQCEGLTEFVEC